jgi:hypothetical protein
MTTQSPVTVNDEAPPVLLQIGDRTFRIVRYEPHGYSIHLRRANGGWQRWMRLHHLSDKRDVEAVIQVVHRLLER